MLYASTYNIIKPGYYYDIKCISVKYFQMTQSCKKNDGISKSCTSWHSIKNKNFTNQPLSKSCNR